MPAKSALEATRNGIVIASFMSPGIGSCCSTITGRVACRSEGGGKIASTIATPRQSGRGGVWAAAGASHR